VKTSRASGVLLLHKARTPEAREVFTRYRATASARAMESIGWAGFHAVCCLKKFEPDCAKRAQHRWRLGGCCAVLFFVLATPVLAVLLNGTGIVADHGFAFGFAALTWSVLVEWPDQPARDARYIGASQAAARQADRDVAWRTAVIVALDLMVYGVFRTGWMDGSGQALLLGSSLVAVADITANVVTLVLGARNGSIFRDVA